MPGLNPKVAVHHLAVKKSSRPIKQGQRRFRPELVPSIETEVNRLIEVGFIREVLYPTWLSNIVLVRKQKWTNKGHETLTFMDGSSWYNQIRMDPADEELTAFRTPNGVYCYKVMFFRLKNIR
ncbi:hypothetical protein LIER_23676 [Lithospermum erythrorhizon]|uniref:Reverse transcriptase domain-containing protein n=1 Tax=Lithospermum erythrorhizon TaxID=34254 RepID=A0AAV3R129_LITER